MTDERILSRAAATIAAVTARLWILWGVAFTPLFCHAATAALGIDSEKVLDFARAIKKRVPAEAGTLADLVNHCTFNCHAPCP